MKTKQHAEITIETHEVTVIRISRRQTSTVFCSVCGMDVPHFSVLHAGAMLRLSETEVFRMAESGQIHSRECVGGGLLICGRSLGIESKA